MKNDNKTEYPKYFKFYKGTFIVKFTSLVEGEVVWLKEGYKDWYIGETNDNLISHTDKSVWEELTDKETSELLGVDVKTEAMTKVEWIQAILDGKKVVSNRYPDTYIYMNEENKIVYKDGGSVQLNNHNKGLCLYKEWYEIESNKGKVIYCEELKEFAFFGRYKKGKIYIDKSIEYYLVGDVRLATNEEIESLKV